MHRGRTVGLFERVGPRLGLDDLDRRVGIAVLVEEASAVQHHPEGGGTYHEVAVGGLVLEAGRQEQVLAPLALVGSGEAHIDDPACPAVVDGAQYAGRCFENERTIVKVDPHNAVGGAGVPREDDGAWVYQVFPDTHGRVGRSPLEQGTAHRGHARHRQGQQVGLDGTLEVQVVEQCLDRGIVREPVKEAQRAQPGLNFVGPLDSGRNRGLGRVHRHQCSPRQASEVSSDAMDALGRFPRVESPVLLGSGPAV